MAARLSLGFIVLGIGFVSWAIFNIVDESDLAVPPEYAATSANIKTAASLDLHMPDQTLTPQYSAQIVNVESTPPVVPTPAKDLYTEYIAEGDIIGSLTIPVLEQKFPIIQGTGTEDLKKGVGHFIQSVFPGEDDNCVLSGHRDTVFTKLGKLKIGDQLITQTSAGTFTYEIKNIRIVQKDDKTVIVPTGHAVLTITTCYPFRFVGSAPDRYILTADLLTSK